MPRTELFDGFGLNGSDSSGGSVLRGVPSSLIPPLVSDAFGRIILIFPQAATSIATPVVQRSGSMSTPSASHEFSPTLNRVTNPRLRARRIRGYPEGKLPCGPGVRRGDLDNVADTPEQRQTGMWLIWSSETY